MKKWVCTVCGYVYEGENAPEKCPQCGVPASKFKEQASEGMTWACEHEVGVAQGSPEDIMMDLRANFEGECSEVGMYPVSYTHLYVLFYGRCNSCLQKKVDKAIDKPA